MSEQKFLVTGASGFIGGHMVDLLLSHGIKVRAMVRDRLKAVRLEALENCELVVADLTRKETLAPAVSGTTGIFHIGGVFRQAGLPDSAYFEINHLGVKNLFDAAICEGVPRIIHCSTSGVLGHVAKLPSNEDSPYNPSDVYQESKAEGEKLALEYFKAGKIKGLIIRPAMVYGPRDSRFLKIFRMVKKGTFFYVGSGDVYTHFIDVRDLVNAFFIGMKKVNLNAEIYQIAGEKEQRLFEVINMVADYLNVRRPWLHIPLKPMQVLAGICEDLCEFIGAEPPLHRRRIEFFTHHRFFDTQKARRDLDYKPAKAFEIELKDILDSYIKEGLL